MKKITFLFCLLATIASGQIRQSVQRTQFSKRNFTITFPASALLNLPVDATTSAGIYRGESLVRTLWSNVAKPAGNIDFSASWDGLDDAGNATPDTIYSVRLLYGNPTYTWEGVVGNTSDSLTGATVWHHGEGISDMAQAGNNVYVAVGYNEGKSSHNKFLYTKPQQNIELTPGLSGGVGRFVETDSTLVYWGCSTNDGSNVYIAASRVSDDVFVTLPNSTSLGTAGGSGHVVYSGVWNLGSADLTGLAVQRTGDYVFTTQAALNRLQVRKKSDGSVAQTITMTGAGLLALAGNTLFVRPQSTTALTSINSYSVNSDGTLSPGYTLTGFSSVSWVSANSTGTELAVVDAGTQQRVRFFDVATGAEKTPLGQPGGYAATTKVANDRFMFEDRRRGGFGYNFGALQPFVSYMADGSIWVGDRGNLRVQHFAANHSTYLGQIAQLGYSYSTAVDANDPTRIFSGYLEFKRDYSKPLGPQNGSWVLWRNWGQKADLQLDSPYGRLEFVKTLSNGRTYAEGFDNKVFNRRLIELDTTNGLRSTPVTFHYTANLQPDGSVITSSTNSLSTTFAATRFPLTGFDASNNPVYGSGVVIGTKASITGADPVATSGNPHGIGRLDNGTFVSWSGDRIYPITGTPERGFGFRAGLLRPGATSWSAVLIPSTQRYYVGYIPTDGAFDNGNDVNIPGGSLVVRGNFFAYNYVGENWKGFQTNIWNLYHGSGLMVGQWGTTGTFAQAIGGSTAAQMAGNAATSELVRVGSDYYVYHCDEGYHAGVHSWKLSGLDNVQVLSLPLIKSSITKTPVLSYTDLMAGFPRNDTLRNGAVAGWSLSIAPYNTGIYNRFNAVTTRHTYRKDENDLQVVWFPPAPGTSVTVSRTLPISAGASTWSVTGQIAFPNSGEPGTTALEVLDAAGKVICRINKSEAATNTYFINAAQVFSGNSRVINNRMPGSLQPFVFSRLAGGQVSVSYYGFTQTGVFESGADASMPTTLRINFVNPSGRSSSHMMDIANTKSYSQ